MKKILPALLLLSAFFSCEKEYIVDQTYYCKQAHLLTPSNRFVSIHENDTLSFTIRIVETDNKLDTMMYVVDKRSKERFELNVNDAHSIPNTVFSRQSLEQLLACLGK